MTAADSASSALPYTPDMPMHPRPIADTDSPLLPNGRLCIWSSWSEARRGIVLLMGFGPRDVRVRGAEGRRDTIGRLANDLDQMCECEAQILVVIEISTSPPVHLVDR